MWALLAGAWIGVMWVSFAIVILIADYIGSIFMGGVRRTLEHRETKPQGEPKKDVSGQEIWETLFITISSFAIVGVIVSILILLINL